MSRTTRNVIIVLLIALVVDVVPGGGTGANVVGQAVSLAFLAAIAWFASIMYRQNRYTLDGLGERRRAVLYVAIGVVAVTLTATNRLWHSPGGSVAWLVLMGAAVYGVVSVVVAARR